MCGTRLGANPHEVTLVFGIGTHEVFAGALVGWLLAQHGAGQPQTHALPFRCMDGDRVSGRQFDTARQRHRVDGQILNDRAWLLILAGELILQPGHFHEVFERESQDSLAFAVLVL